MQLRRTSVILLVGVLAASVSSAKKAQPVLDWKPGVLWETPDPCNETSGLYKETFLILGDDTLYHVAHNIPIRHKPNVSEGGSVKYAITEGDFYLQDEDGRVFKLAVVKQEIDPNAQEHLKNGQRPCQP